MQTEMNCTASILDLLESNYLSTCPVEIPLPQTSLQWFSKTLLFRSRIWHRFPPYLGTEVESVMQGGCFQNGIFQPSGLFLRFWAEVLPGFKTSAAHLVFLAVSCITSMR
jgi:hypothetical protein